MTITREQVEAVIAEANCSQNPIDVCSTNSRNRRVELIFEYDIGNNVGADLFHIHNAGPRVASTSDIDAAVLLFNYYGSRELEPR